MLRVVVDQDSCELGLRSLHGGLVSPVEQFGYRGRPDGCNFEMELSMLADVTVNVPSPLTIIEWMSFGGHSLVL